MAFAFNRSIGRMSASRFVTVDGNTSVIFARSRRLTEQRYIYRKPQRRIGERIRRTKTDDGEQQNEHQPKGGLARWIDSFYVLGRREHF